MKKNQSMLLLLGCLAAAIANADEGQPGGPGGPRHMGPPPEFLAACKGQAIGTRTQVKTPRGDTVSGTCQLMFVPDHRPGGPGGGEMAPPQQKTPPQQ